MTSRERVANAFDFKPCDKAPVALWNSPCGLNELGQPLLDLFLKYDNDFNIFKNTKITFEDNKHTDRDGNYQRIFKDEWGAIKDERVFGMHAITIDFPLNNWDNLKNYKAPNVPNVTEKDIEKAKNHMSEKYLKTGWISIFEIMHSVRPMDKVLMDLAEDNTEINTLADIICDYQEKIIQNYLKTGCDCIEFGDDFGTTESLLISPRIWKKFFKPRYERLITPIKKVGKKVAFHSCGQVWTLIEDFKDMGADSIWPQINLFDLKELKAKLWDLKLALTIHPDRGNLMQKGTPEDIIKEIHKLNHIFEPQKGGSWFHVEIDHGFSFENSKALIETVCTL